MPLAGVSSLDRVLAACPPGPRIVVGPPDERDRPGVSFAREDPPFGGPVAALIAGLRLVDAAPVRDVLVLAGDLPLVTSGTLRALLDGPPGTVRCAVDERSRLQYLCSCWPSHRLFGALPPSGAGGGMSMRRLFTGLAPSELVPVRVDPQTLIDLDTPADLKRVDDYLAGE